MKKILEAFLIFFILISIASTSYIIYEQISKMLRYRETVLGVSSNYLTLQKQYDNYKEQAKNLKKVIILAKNPESNINQVANIVQNYTNKIKGDVSIYFKNITTNESLIVNEGEKYYMASLYKVILALYLLDEINHNKLNLDDKVGTTSATIRFALDKIITESNNELALILAEEYNWQKIQKTMKTKLGIDFKLNKKLEISVTNVGILFENITSSLKIPQEESEYILKLLGNQKITSKLPKYLAKNVYSHNKTGEFENYSHDAGIFYTPKANYILVFMSKTENPSATNEHMALMSKEIYESLNK